MTVRSREATATETAEKAVGGAYIPASVVIGKRALDIFLALIVLALAILPLPFIALAIRCTSPGPVFYRQMRVGKATSDFTHLFMVVKLRSMYQDAEARTGAVWASKNDPRVTPVGRFLRRTRLDELPQIWNVLRGEMSFIGPRPERPQFYGKLVRQVPYYVERIQGVKPGITGFAQVHLGYDETVGDVRRKVMYDHAYAARLARFRTWLAADLEILLRTIGVALLQKGH